MSTIIAKFDLPTVSVVVSDTHQEGADDRYNVTAYAMSGAGFTQRAANISDALRNAAEAIEQHQ